MPRAVSSSRGSHLSTRNVRGSGSMKKGNLEDGCFWINIKRAWSEQVFTRGTRINENETLEEAGLAAVEDALDREHPPALPEGFTVDVQFKRGKSMFSDEHRNDRIKDHFLGAETIHVKVFDASGHQMMAVRSPPHIDPRTGRMVSGTDYWTDHTPEASRRRLNDFY